MRTSRTPEIMGDAGAMSSSRSPLREFTGPFCIDDKQLYTSGVRDFDRVDASVPMSLDFFVPDDNVPPPGVTVMPCASYFPAQNSSFSN
jgi:citronellol/citronellal dehydrogenase